LVARVGRICSIRDVLRSRFSCRSSISVAGRGALESSHAAIGRTPLHHV
jgi:hypothetical protein